MTTRKPLKVSGLLAAGKLIAAPGVATSDAFDAHPADAAQPLALASPPPIPTEWELVDGQIVDLPVDLIDDSPYQPEDEARERYDPAGIDDLAHTIAAEGQQDPIQVRRKGHRYELISGHRRLRAIRSLGRMTIKALIFDKTDSEAERSVMVHNEGRAGRCDFAKAKLYARAKLRGYAKTQEELALMFATNQSEVSMRLSMLTLPAPILALLEEKKDLIGMNAAQVVKQLVKEHPGEIEIITKAVARIKTDGAPESSIKGWVAQTLQAKGKTQRARSNKPKVVTDDGGRQLYTAKLEGRVISVRISALDIDADQTLDLVLAALRNRPNATGSE